jgi:hypothetical protein
MSTNHLDRRDFSRMSLAALGGAMAGTTALAQQAAPVNPPKPIAPPKVIAPPNVTPPAKAPKTNPPPKDAAKPADPQDKAAADKAAADKAAADKAAADKKKKNEKPKEIHLCRGLNSCQGKGKSGDNKCAGQGTCATTLNAPHECATGNACKGQGGCSETVGKNQCAGLGNGSVPLLDEEWPRLRKEFEARMARLKKKVGPAPASADEEQFAAQLQEAEAKAAAEQAAKEQAMRDGTAPPDDATAAKQGPNARPGGNRPGTRPAPNGTRPAPRNTAENKTPTRPAPRTTPPPKTEEDTADILGELTGGDKKKTPKPAPKK